MTRTARRAAALPMVVMSLGLVGALAVAGVFATRRAVDDARADNRSLVLRPAAEHAIVAALAGVDSTLLARGPGATIAGPEFITPQVVTSTWITVTSGASVWVVSEAVHAGNNLIHNRLALSCRWVLAPPQGCTGATWFELP